MQLRTVLRFRGNAALATLALASAGVSIASFVRGVGAFAVYVHLGRVLRT